MPATEKLRDIRKFTDLVRYLESELEWPVEAGSFDDLTFEYQPAELGLKDEDAVKIRKIHQLRPLASGQPWGIFFVEFENKKLPVVVLRRILSHLVVKKRQSANKADQAVWNPEDLLFISAFGDEAGDQREIAFAHFHQQPGDLPTLRVLGWDGGDTPLKLDYVAGELQTKLHWPANPKDQNAWRTQWSGAFRHKLGHTIKTADALAEVLAGLAKRIRDAAKRLMKAESESGPLTKLYKGFQTALIHDLKPDDFADTYAQTITYGLLTAAISRTEMSEGARGTVLYAENVTDMVPVTNPFLKEMLQTFLKVGGRKGGIDFDELGIQDVVELLRGDETDLPAILRDFGNKTRGEDPVIHFYEHFLSAYNKQLKIQRGVFYTPQPVVSYIVRSVHELLQTEFGLEDGLASTATWGEMLEKFGGTFGGTSSTSPTSKEKGDKDGDSRSSSLRQLKIPDGVKPTEMFVQILDPATGTATFLVEVIDVIFKHLQAKWHKGGLAAMPALNAAHVSPSPGGEGRGEGGRSSIVNRKSPIVNFPAYWNQYVPLALLPRLHGYELMMAPYAIAHMKIGLKLHETGYHFGTEERARIYLTNALEPKVTQLPQIGFDALAHEAAAVNEIKWYKRFTVVIGNPPYNNRSDNKTAWIMDLIEVYKTTVRREETQIQGLSDDYIKFLRLGDWNVQQTGVGILGMITNNGFLDGHIFKDFREYLAKNFHIVRAVNLHGDSRKKENTPDGSTDENVFDIMQGVSLTIVSKNIGHIETTIAYADIWGKREVKYRTLAEGIPSDAWIPVQRTAAAKMLMPVRNSLGDWDAASPLAECFGTGNWLVDKQVAYGSGFKSRQDEFAITFEPAALASNIEMLLKPGMTESELRTQFALCTTAHWNFARARKRLPNLNWREGIRRVMFRPFDFRFAILHPDVVTEYRREIMSQLERPNLALLATRKATEGFAVFVTRVPCGHKIVGNYDMTTVFPVYRYTIEDGAELSFGSEPKEVNFSPTFLKRLSNILQLKLLGRTIVGVTPEDIFHYAYGVFHSPGYRSRYAEFLKIDFPRLPLTGKLELFRALARLGGELTALHLLEFEVERVTPCAPGQKPSYAQLTELVGTRSTASQIIVEKPTWSKDTVWLDKAQTTGFQGVREDVWNFHIGGYQVCEKWLKDRKGRTLSADDRTHYQKIIVALSETIRLMKEIDAVIEAHGGWPIK